MANRLRESETRVVILALLKLTSHPNLVGQAAHLLDEVLLQLSCATKSTGS